MCLFCCILYTLSSIAFLPCGKEVPQPSCEIAFHTWPKLSASDFTASSLPWGTHSNSRAGKGKQWHQISAHTYRVWAQVEIGRDISDGFYSACAWCLQNKEYPISGTEFVADLEEKFQISLLIRTATDLFTSTLLTHLFLMKPWRIWERRKKICKTKMFAEFSRGAKSQEAEQMWSCHCGTGGGTEWGWW